MMPDVPFGLILLPGLIAIAALSFLWWLVRRLGARNRSVPDQPELWAGRDHTCPRCGTPMEQGWALLGKGAIWSPRAAGRPGTFAHIGRALPNTISLSLPPAANMAWRCGDCRLLLIDHDKLVGRG